MLLRSRNLGRRTYEVRNCVRVSVGDAAPILRAWGTERCVDVYHGITCTQTIDSPALRLFCRPHQFRHRSCYHE